MSPRLTYLQGVTSDGKSTGRREVSPRGRVTVGPRSRLLALPAPPGGGRRACCAPRLCEVLADLHVLLGERKKIQLCCGPQRSWLRGQHSAGRAQSRSQSPPRDAALSLGGECPDLEAVRYRSSRFTASSLSRSSAGQRGRALVKKVSKQADAGLLLGPWFPSPAEAVPNEPSRARLHRTVLVASPFGQSTTTVPSARDYLTFTG